MNSTYGISDERSGLLDPLLVVHRARVSCGKNSIRFVYRSSLSQANDEVSLAALLANMAPEFYRPIPALVQSLQGGYPLTVFKEALAKIPTAAGFRESHFGEILGCVFAEEVLGLRRIYSKLSLLTAENANAYKMDLLLYDPDTEPLELVLAEVKSSPKTAAEGLPARHDKSCYSDLLRSFRDYSDTDLEFDLITIKDNLQNIPPEDGQKIRAALQPYRRPPIRYAGIAVIDDSTYDKREARVLGTRQSPKEFEADIVCLEGCPEIADDVYRRLDSVLNALRAACS